MENEHSRQFVTSLARGFALLEIICKSPRPFGLSELAKECGLSISTIQRLAFTLQDLGLICRDAKTKKFLAGPRTIAMAFAIMDHPLKKIAAPIMASLADEIDEVVGLCALSGHHIVLLEIVLKTQKIIHINISPGDTLPLHATASGKVILAYLDSGQRKILLKHNAMVGLTDKTITSQTALESQLRQVKHVGYATAVDEGSYGLSTIAAPVRNNKNEVIAALTIMVPTARTAYGNPMTVYKEKIIESADRISFAIGYQAT